MNMNNEKKAHDLIADKNLIHKGLLMNSLTARSSDAASDRDTDGPGADDAICFGPFALYAQQHLLLKNGEPVSLGSRALLLLIAMVSRAGELLEKAELMALVWPRVVVEECNLRAQVVTLRRALGGDGEFGYIVTVPGRGYRFMAPVTLQPVSRQIAAEPETSSDLPAMMSEVIGRGALLDALDEQLELRRFVTITGPGGIGKTTLALALANRMVPRFPQGVRLIDLASVTAGQLVHVVIASALDLNCAPEGALLAIAQRLAEGKTLLVLDNCEQVLEETARAVENILRNAAQCCVLITSREPLHAEGEFVHDLAALEVPSANANLSAVQAMDYSAIRLFVERVAAHDLNYQLSDPDVAAAIAICRKLDGNALAIEIAAARVRAFGIVPLVELLDGSFRLQMTGRRTALPRHRTLSAALDWTYSILAADEQAMLRQLSVFSGSFSLNAVKAVVEIGTEQAQDSAQLLENLMDKSLLIATEDGPGKRYRLLETTRLYASEKLTRNDESNVTSRRHANFVLDQLRGAVQDLLSTEPQDWLALYGPEIDSVRSALDWAYCADGDPVLGVELTLVSIPLWLRLSLIGEGQDWVNRGLQAGADGMPILPRQRMQLLTLSASVMVLAYGGGAHVRQAWLQISADADLLEDAEHQLRALWGLWNDCCCRNQHSEALELANRYIQLNNVAGSSDRQLLGNRMRATSQFYMADLEGARRSITEALCSPRSANAHIIDMHFDQPVAARSLKAQIQLLQGNVGPALLTIDENVGQAISLNHPATLWYSLCMSALPSTLLVGHLQKFGYYLGLLQDSMAGHDLPLWQQFSICFESILLIRQGAPEEAVPRLGEVLQRLQDHGDSPLHCLIRSEYAQGLAMLGLEQLGLEVISDTLHTAQSRNERWFLPELLRIKAQLLLGQGLPSLLPLVRSTLSEAHGEARKQGASFWTSRIAADLARLQEPELVCISRSL